MKNQIKFLTALMAIAAVCVFFSGCKTPVQRTAYNTISSVDQAASLAIDAYYALVIKGVIPTNSVPQVSDAFNKLHTDCIIAAAAAQNGISSTATPDMLLQLSNLTSLISAVKPSTR